MKKITILFLSLVTCLSAFAQIRGTIYSSLNYRTIITTVNKVESDTAYGLSMTNTSTGQKFENGYIKIRTSKPLNSGIYDTDLEFILDPNLVQGQYSLKVVGSGEVFFRYGESSLDGEYNYFDNRDRIAPTISEVKVLTKRRRRVGGRYIQVKVRVRDDADGLGVDESGMTLGWKLRVRPRGMDKDLDTRIIKRRGQYYTLEAMIPRSNIISDLQGNGNLYIKAQDGQGNWARKDFKIKMPN